MNRRVARLLLLSALSLIAGSALAQRAVVLVTGNDCAMEQINMLDIRKAYFGITVSYEGNNIRAMRLNNDDSLNRVFFQTVVAMSERLYERRLLSIALKYGTPRPSEYRSVPRLVEGITSSQCAIAYMWREDAEAYSSLKTVRLLWQGH